jgi:two-component system LytT family response regulator
MADTKTLQVMIADDEPLARQRIEDLLARDPLISVVAAASNGPEAVEAIRKFAPDLVFLDVQMPGMTGFEVVAAIGVEQMPVTVFVTAFDQFALKAFEVAAIDYLVKPFDDERFAQTLARARKTIELRQVERLTKQLATLLHESSSPQPPKRQYLDRIPVEMRGQLRVVPVSKIDYITASGSYAELHAAGKTFAVRERMQTLEEKLDPAVFFRLHRSAIARLDHIDALLRASGGDYAVRLKDGTELPLSRSRREQLEQVMGKG